MTLVAASAFTTGTVLASLGILHVFWGLRGSQAGPGPFVPEVDGRPAFRPSPAACFTVAALLFAAALLVLASAGFVAAPLPSPWTDVGTAGVGVVFLLRAVGDFRLVGFFKRVRGTAFARLDTRVFSPLCVAIGAACLGVALWS